FFYATFFFFVSSSCNHRVLHSFPTRRSSDLVLRRPHRGKGAALNHAIHEASGEILLCLDADTLIARDAIHKLVRHFTDASVGAVDRKSTRLNSSHDQISYAVFCLKKKKRNE